MISVSVRGNSAMQAMAQIVSNAFTVGGSCTSGLPSTGDAPVQELFIFTWAPQADASAVFLDFLLPPGVMGKSCSVRYPGTPDWLAIPQPLPTGAGQRWQFPESVKLQRSVALIKCT